MLAQSLWLERKETKARVLTTETIGGQKHTGKRQAPQGTVEGVKEGEGKENRQDRQTLPRATA